MIKISCYHLVIIGYLSKVRDGDMYIILREFKIEGNFKDLFTKIRVQLLIRFFYHFELLIQEL